MTTQTEPDRLSPAAREALYGKPANAFNKPPESTRSSGFDHEAHVRFWKGMAGHYKKDRDVAEECITDICNILPGQCTDSDAQIALTQIINRLIQHCERT